MAEAELRGLEDPICHGRKVTQGRVKILGAGLGGAPGGVPGVPYLCWSHIPNTQTMVLHLHLLPVGSAVAEHRLWGAQLWEPGIWEPQFWGPFPALLFRSPALASLLRETGCDSSQCLWHLESAFSMQLGPNDSRADLQNLGLLFLLKRLPRTRLKMAVFIWSVHQIADFCSLPIFWYC